MEENLDKNLNNVVDSCGMAPEGISYIDPGNNPNFVRNSSEIQKFQECIRFSG